MKTAGPVTAETRSSLYSGLADFYRPPTWEMITKGMDRFLRGHAEMLFHPSIPPAFAGLMARLEKETYEKDLGEFQSEYERLFFDPPRGESVAPPFASFYLRETITLYPSKQLESCWRRIDKAVPGPNEPMQETIEGELRFLGLLCENQAKARKEGSPEVENCLKREQFKFLADHLTQWIEAFARRLGSGSRLAFYQLLSHATYNFVSSDSRRLQEHLKR